MDMLLAIREAAAQLPTLLENKSLWVNSLDVDYHPPRVERLWTPFTVNGTMYRLMMHRLHPCRVEDSLFHPHPWPSSVAILDGQYKSYYGYGPQNGPEPERVGPELFSAGSVYHMSDPGDWHLVAPTCVTMSIMVIGLPYPKAAQRRRTESDNELLNCLKGLKQEAIADMLEFFSRPATLSAFDSMTAQAVSQWSNLKVK